MYYIAPDQGTGAAYMKQQLLAMCELHASPSRGRSSYFESSCAGRLLGLQPYLEFSDFIFAYFDAKLYQ